MIFGPPLYPKGNPLGNHVAVQETGKFLPQRSRTGEHESAVTEILNFPKIWKCLEKVWEQSYFCRNFIWAIFHDVGWHSPQIEWNLSKFWWCTPCMTSPMEILGAVTWHPKIWKCSGNTRRIFGLRKTHIVYKLGPYGISKRLERLGKRLKKILLMIWLEPCSGPWTALE